MSKPILLLDVDGVLNAYTFKVPIHAWPEGQWVLTTGTSSWPGDDRVFKIKAAQPVLDFISDLHHSGQVEIRWHTTWQHDAQVLAKTLGLPHFEVVQAPEFHQYQHGENDGWWKYPATLRAAGEGRPLIWIDDDTAHHWHLSGSERQAIEELTSTLIISPTDTDGLIQADLDAIADFIRLHTESPDSNASGK